MSTVAASAADVPSIPNRGRRYWVRTIAFWFFTLWLSFENVAGSIWDLLQIDYVRWVMTHLGYPHYLLLIIGACKFPCAVVLMLPGLPRLKEWAYAGAVINYGGAAASHFFAGDPLGQVVSPLGFVAFALGSWALRPPDRRLLSVSPTTKVRPLAWAVPLVLIGVFVVLSFVMLSTAPPVPPR
jgi:hypothetical protein